ncbi:hypothetical protein HaLaN_27390 [Haematococcus lacustris]|uniref:Uncharacterized protein n=1 Tax=Haematococcus lacustris TaxID=44745 RepID=A0A6A0A9V2_HAELA|nr:hypothetical protein HaLaN_27390 [Haematococcus lacustris]
MQAIKTRRREHGFAVRDAVAITRPKQARRIFFSAAEAPHTSRSFERRPSQAPDPRSRSP